MNTKKITSLFSSSVVAEHTRRGKIFSCERGGIDSGRGASEQGRYFSAAGMRSAAFTLVEMLIVLSIIGILTSVMIASTTLSRAKARDTRRISDMKEIQLGLALYYDVNKIYPAGSNVSVLSVLVTQKYLPTIPTDPDPTKTYEYMVTSGKYCFGVKLESDIPNDSASCTSASSGSVANYKSSPPN